MLENFIYAKEKSLFEEALNNGEVLDEAIVFIEDTKEIWNHGTYFDGSTFDPSNIEASILNIIDSYATKAEIPTKVSQLENDANYILDDVVSDGVYAVDANGKLIDYTIADSSCIGVALITDNQRILISKANVTDDTNTTLYWGKNLYGKDVASITNISSSNEAKQDFNGKANTAAIIAAYSQYSVDMDSRDMCKVLSTYAEGGFTDWYLPAAGQLYEMYTNKTDINAALVNIGGTAFESYGYWSSSEYDASLAWNVNFNDGHVDYNFEIDSRRVRFVRDISIKPLKEKVSEIEASVSELELNYFKWSKLSLPSFTIEGVSYDFEEGMTWEDWVNSEYNIGGFIINNEFIYDTKEGEVTKVFKGDFIVEDYNYDILY